MSLFKENVIIELTVEMLKYGNSINFFLGNKNGEITKFSDFGYSFVTDTNENYFFTFNNNKIPNDYDGVFYIDIKNLKEDIVEFIKTCKKTCLYYNFPSSKKIIDTWKNNFKFKEEIIDENKKVIVNGLRPPQIGALHSILAHWHESLVDLATFNKVQNVFKGKRWYNTKPNHKNCDFPMRDFLTCEICGGQITGSKSTGRTKKYAYYHCRNKCQTRVRVEDAHIKIASILCGLQISQNIKELFTDVLRNSEAQINGDRNNQLKLKIDLQKSLKSQIEDAEDLLLSRSIDKDRFDRIIERINGKLSVVEDDIEILRTKKDSVNGYVDSGLELLGNLDEFFLNGDYNGKRILAGSIFTEKLIFGNESCRTTKVNEVIEVLTRNIKASEGIKKRKAVKNDSFSVNVPGAGVEPARFPTGV